MPATEIGHAPATPDVFPGPSADADPTRWLSGIANDLRELNRYWPVVSNMVVQELRVKYNRSVLGFLWTLVNPILMMTTQAIVFSQIFHITLNDYAIYLFAGIVPFTFLSGVLNECALCIVTNETLIRRIYLPKLIFPLVRTLINLVIFGLSLVAMFALLKPMGATFSMPMLSLPLLIVAWAVFAFGLGMTLAVLNTFYRDCSHLMTVFLQIWYFSTPILYKTEDFGERAWMFWLNPAFPFIRMFQMILRYGEWPDLTTTTVAAGLAIASLGIGYAVFKTHESKLVFRL